MVMVRLDDDIVELLKQIKDELPGVKSLSGAVRHIMDEANKVAENPISDNPAIDLSAIEGQLNRIEHRELPIPTIDTEGIHNSINTLVIEFRKMKDEFKSKNYHAESYFDEILDERLDDAKAKAKKAETERERERVKNRIHIRKPPGYVEPNSSKPKNDHPGGIRIRKSTLPPYNCASCGIAFQGRHVRCPGCNRRIDWSDPRNSK